MRTSRGWLIASVLAGATLMACGPGMTPMDGGTDGARPDSTMMPDGTTPDGTPPPDGTTPPDGMTPPDARPDARPDAPPTMGNPCDMANIVDLTSRMPDAMGVVRVMGDNLTRPETGGLPTPMGCIGTMAMKTHQTAYRYRMRAAGALRVSTINPGTDEMFDSILMVTNMCSTAGMPLVCNDDFGGTRQSQVTTGPLMMGQEVFVLLGGYSPPTAGGDPQGAFEVTFTELTPIATGMPCNPMTDVCAMGAQCLAGATGNTCVADGTQGGACRAMAPRCDGMLECSGTPARCRAIIPMGMPCDPTGASNVCMGTSRCAPNADFSMYTCVAEGTAGGACRAGSPRCDAGTECSTASGAGVCQRAVMAGSACDLSASNSTLCTMSLCLPTGRAMGVLTGACRAPVMETEPNNMMGMPQTPVTMSTVYSGSAAPTDDVDCFGVTVPAMGSLYLETNAGTLGGPCPAMADTVITVYNAAGMTIAENDDISMSNTCSRINGLSAGPLNRLPAGNYAVCVSNYMGEVSMNYNLVIGLVP